MIGTNNIFYVLTHNSKESDDNLSYNCFGIDGVDSQGQKLISLDDISLKESDVEYLVNKLNTSNTQAEIALSVCNCFVDVLHTV